MIDSIFNEVAVNTSTELTFTGSLATMAIALAFGLIISLTYIFTHRDSYQQSFAVTLTMLPIILSVIILFVGSNIARAFSLAGTLSIIRFRSAPGDPEDIGYIFFDIAAGLACGVGLYAYGTAFVLVLCLFMFIIKKLNFAKKSETAKILKITIPENLDYQGAFDDVFMKYTKKYKLQRVKTTDLGSLYELVYNIEMTDTAGEKDFIDQLRCRNGNLNIVLSLASDTPYGI